LEFDFGQIALDLKKGSYSFLGSGSGRRVFDLGGGYVVKAAINSKGIAQNKAEYNISQKSDSGLFANITAVSEKFDMVIMEKADPITDFLEILSYYNVNSARELFRLKEFRDSITEFSLLEPDLRRIKNWGRIDGKPVIIDYGFTIKVRNHYYFPF
jgi:hypothetical protein